MKTFDGYKKRNLTDKDYALLAGGGHKALDTLFSALSSDTTNAIKITVGGTEKSITTDTLKTSLGLGSNAYTSTAYLPLAGGTMTGDITMNGMETNINWNVDYLGGWARSFIIYKQHNSSSGDLVDVFHLGGYGSDNGFEYAYIGTASYNGNNLRFNKNGTITIGSGTIWHSNNDGSGSGLDADLIDGYHASSLWRSDGGTWNPSANIKLNASGNGQEWSFDITRNGYTGCYWHVWDSSLSSMLKVNADNGKVYAPYNFVGNLEGNASSATKLQTARTIWGLSFNGTANVDNTLRIRQTTGNYCEGIRIQTSDGAWATIILGATADSGTNTNAWSIHRKADNNFAISRNSSDGVNGLVMTSTGMGLGTAAPNYRLDVNGAGKFNQVYIYDGTNALLYLKTAAAGAYAYLAAYNTGGQYGADVILHSGSAMVLGAGESAAAMYSNNVDSLRGSENLYLTADSSIKIFTNCDSIANRRYVVCFDTTGYTYFNSYINIGGHEKNASSPTYVWGSNSSDNFLRSYQTNKLSVSYSSSSGNADTVDNKHASDFATATHSHIIASTITTFSAGGWKAVARHKGHAGRGHFTILFASTGGNNSALFLTMHYDCGWSYNPVITGYGKITYITGIRAVKEANDIIRIDIAVNEQIVSALNIYLLDAAIDPNHIYGIDLLSGVQSDLSGTAICLVSTTSGIFTSGNSFAANFYSSSDIRLKNNISNISKSIRSFNWNDTGLKSYGLIAQEIEDEYPELVSNNDNGYKSINYTSALCMIIAKLENTVDILKEKIELLELNSLNSN